MRLKCYTFQFSESAWQVKLSCAFLVKAIWNQYEAGAALGRSGETWAEPGTGRRGGALRHGPSSRGWDAIAKYPDRRCVWAKRDGAKLC